MKPHHVLAIRSPAAQALSPTQKRFNSLAKRIAAQREQLALWEQSVPLFRERHAREFQPLLRDYRLLSVELARLLHAAQSRKGLTKAERATISELITEQAGALAESAPDEALRAEMKQLYNQHAGSDYDADGAESEALARDMARDLLGVDIPEDVDLQSPEDLLRHLQQQMHEQQAAEPQAGASTPGKKPSRREQQAATQAQQASQSLREIYRKLASALHPDRETDPAERARKTALMQRANDAYAQNRLLDLLQLQLEAEQIDPEHIAGLSEQRLKHYNRVLAEQLAELEQQNMGAEAAFCMEFQLESSRLLKPGQVMDILREQIAQLTLDTHRLRQQMARLDDLPTFKRWLKTEREALQAYQQNDLLGLFGR